MSTTPFMEFELTCLICEMLVVSFMYVFGSQKNLSTIKRLFILKIIHDIQI